MCLGSNSRSPGKVPAPGGLSTAASLATGGRTIKDYEDQLGALQKENFQLKLRIYFLEEKMGILGLGTADENAVKKNIELKVCILNIACYNLKLYNRVIFNVFFLI